MNAYRKKDFMLYPCFTQNRMDRIGKTKIESNMGNQRISKMAPTKAYLYI